MASLIDIASNRRHSDSFQDLFLPRDIELIESIPLSSIQAEDKLVWPFSPSGSYSVKSGYNFLYESQSFDTNEYQPKNNKLWKNV